MRTTRTQIKPWKKRKGGQLPAPAKGGGWKNHTGKKNVQRGRTTGKKGKREKEMESEHRGETEQGGEGGKMRHRQAKTLLE